LRNSIDRCGQPIKDGGSRELAFLVRRLFRLLAPPFGLFFKDLLKFQSLDHCYSPLFLLLIWARKLQPSRAQQLRQLGYVDRYPPRRVAVSRLAAERQSVLPRK